MLLCSPNQFLSNVVQPALLHLGWTEQSLGVVIAAIPFTVDHSQPSDRRALGPFLMSHEQHWSTWDHYLAANAELASRMRGLASQHRFTADPDLELCLNAGYASAIAAAFLKSQLADQTEACDLTCLICCWQQVAGQQLSMNLFSSLCPSLEDQWRLAA